MKPAKILYIHGFNSSPRSHKAQLLAAHMQQLGKPDALLYPQIPVIPGEAAEFLQQLVEVNRQDYQLSFVGSSLGGYYASWLAEKYSAPAVLINPSVRPFETLRKYLGENRFYYEDGSWDFDESHIRQLEDMYIKNITQYERYLVLLQTGDETLDYREAEEKYRGCHCIVEQGGDHGFAGFERHLPRILKFCRMDCD